MRVVVMLGGSKMETNDEKYQDEVLEKVEIYCPLCDKVHFVGKRKRIGEMLIKNEVTSYEEIYFFCQESIDYEEDEFVSGELMNQNLQCARNAYREKHGAAKA